MFAFGQLQYYFRLSDSCFGCPWRSDNQNSDADPVHLSWLYHELSFNNLSPVVLALTEQSSTPKYWTAESEPICFAARSRCESRCFAAHPRRFANSCIVQQLVPKTTQMLYWYINRTATLLKELCVMINFSVLKSSIWGICHLNLLFLLLIYFDKLQCFIRRFYSPSFWTVSIIIYHS